MPRTRLDAPHMTPEQYQQWRDAIFLAYGISEPWSAYRTAEATLLALMPEAERITYLTNRLHESTERLTATEVPGWATELRSDCLTKAWEGGNHELPTFALRSEVALVGISLRSPTPEEKVAAYRRLLLRFFRHGLMPFIDWVEHKGDPQKEAHGESGQVVLFWDGRFRNADDAARRVFRELVDLYDLIRDPAMPPSQEELEAKLHSLDYQTPAESAERYSVGYTHRLAEIAHIILYTEPERWWNTRDTDLAQRFFELHQWPAQWTRSHRPINFNRHTGVVGTSAPRPDFGHAGEPEPARAEAIAEAYLKALEEECPPPDWLPEIL